MAALAGWLAARHLLRTGQPAEPALFWWAAAGPTGTTLLFDLFAVVGGTPLWRLPANVTVVPLKSFTAP